MASSANLNGIFEGISAIPKLHNRGKKQRKLTVINYVNKKTEETPQLQQNHTSRRMAISLASLALFGNAGIGNSLAEDNGLWLTTPIPVPIAKNKIANEDTGTRSFLKRGIYIANIGTKGRKHRLKRYAFDLLALGDLIGGDAWNYVRKYLRLKSTFMYFDFDEVISAAQAEEKQPLLTLANKLFDSVEKLDDAVKKQNLPQTESCYQETTTVLQEVMMKWPETP